MLKITLGYWKYKNKSMHRRFRLDSAPQVWHSSAHAKRSNWEFRRALETMNLGWDPGLVPWGRCGMRHLFLAAFMMLGALVVTFGAASYASNVATPAMIAPVAKATESGTQRARLHVSPRQASIIDQLAESKI
jgi:hypothetical protein